VVRNSFHCLWLLSFAEHSATCVHRSLTKSLYFYIIFLKVFSKKFFEFLYAHRIYVVFKDKIKVPIETNNTLFLQGSEILKSENSMLEKNQNGADHAITNITMVNNTEFEPPFEFSPALNSQI